MGDSEYVAITWWLIMPVLIRLIYYVAYLGRTYVYPVVKRKAEVYFLYAKILFAAIRMYAVFKWRQYFPKEEFVRPVGRSHVEVRYVFRDTEYKIRSRVKRGASMPITVLANGNDVTEELLPYVGPGEDFHGITYTPADFGYPSVTVRREGTDDLTFDEFDAIRIPE